MSHGIVSSSAKQLQIPSSLNSNRARPNLTPTFEPCSSRVTFNTHIQKRQRLKTQQPVPFRTSAIRATCVVEESYGATGSRSFYELLGIPESGTLSEIKQAYKKLARKYHPDVSPPECTEENTVKFIQVQEAYETLSDPNRRASYDRHLASRLHLAFSSTTQFRSKEVRDGWRNQWESQLAELRRRSFEKDLRKNASWAARMRRQDGQGEVGN